MADWLQSGHWSGQFQVSVNDCSGQAVSYPEILRKWPYSPFSTWIKFPCGKPGCIRWGSLEHQPLAESYQVCNVTFGGFAAAVAYDLAHGGSAHGLTVFWDLSSHLPLRDTGTGQTPKWTTTVSEKDEFLLPVFVADDTLAYGSIKKFTIKKWFIMSKGEMCCLQWGNRWLVFSRKGRC